MKFIVFFTAIILGTSFGIIRPYTKEDVSVSLPLQVISPTPTPTIAPYQVVQEIAEVWKDEPTNEIIKALNCFYSESKLKPNAIHVNIDGSRDRGIAQISDKWHPKFTDAQAFDIQGNIQYSYRIYKARKWNAWYGKGCK